MSISTVSPRFGIPTDRLVWEGMKGVEDFFSSITELVSEEGRFHVDVYVSFVPNRGKWAWCVSDVEQMRFYKESPGFDTREDALEDLKKNYG